MIGGTSATRSPVLPFHGDVAYDDNYSGDAEAPSYAQ